MDRLLAKVEEAHVRFRKAIKQAVTEAGQASDLWDDLLETQALEGEQEEEGIEEDPNVNRTLSIAQSTRSMVSLCCTSIDVLFAARSLHGNAHLSMLQAEAGCRMPMYSMVGLSKLY